MSTATSVRIVRWRGTSGPPGVFKSLLLSILLDGLRLSRLEQRRVVRPTLLCSSYIPLKNNHIPTQNRSLS